MMRKERVSAIGFVRSQNCVPMVVPVSPLQESSVARDVFGLRYGGYNNQFELDKSGQGCPQEQSAAIA